MGKLVNLSESHTDHLPRGSGHLTDKPCPAPDSIREGDLTSLNVLDFASGAQLQSEEVYIAPCLSILFVDTDAMKKWPPLLRIKSNFFVWGSL